MPLTGPQKRRTFASHTRTRGQSFRWVGVWPESALISESLDLSSSGPEQSLEEAFVRMQKKRGKKRSLKGLVAQSPTADKTPSFENGAADGRGLLARAGGRVSGTVCLAPRYV